MKNCSGSFVRFAMEKVGRAKDFEKVSKKALRGLGVNTFCCETLK